MAKTAGEGEFSGGGGMIQKHKLDRGGPFTGTEEVWAVYASDVNSTDEPDPRRVGDPASYTSTAAVAEEVIVPVDPEA
jgi:hypothetical protein